MADSDDVNYSEIRFAQSGDRMKRERQKESEDAIYSNVVRPGIDNEDCVYSTVSPHQGGGSESAVSISQAQPKPKDSSSGSKVKTHKRACRRSTILLLFLLFLLLGITLCLGVMYVFKGNSLRAVEQNLTGSLTALQSLQKDKDNLTALVTEQGENHSKERIQLQKELEEVKKNLDDQSKKYDVLSDEKERLQNHLQDLQKEALKNCAAGWEYFSGKCYYFSTDKKNWTESRDACVTMGGHLVIIETEKEQDFLNQRNPAPHEYWIGLTDSAKEAEWRWVDNSLLNDNAKYWWGNEPDDWKGDATRTLLEGEDCAKVAVHGVRLSWYDASCEDHNKCICECKAK
ncbi:hypothetical protein ACEWY4_024983 [Coilia grayii]|uniref:C-type lectin domain-containing protein n=1 Tax=Coilia grayii TaxID=363190 RepID=A0ABD1IXB1_9TELE